MARVSILIGTGYSGEDVLHKLPWLRNLDSKNEIYVASRIKPEIHLTDKLRRVVGKKEFDSITNSIDELAIIAKSFSIIYDAPQLKRHYNDDEVSSIELWLGTSFRFISSMDRRFYDRESMKDVRNLDDVNQYLAGLTEFFKEFFLKNKIEFFINSIEDDAFSVIAYLVAKKVGIHVLGFVSGRFPHQGMMFCKDFVEICAWNDKNVDFKEVALLYSNSEIAGKKLLNKNSLYWKFSAIPKRIEGAINVINFRNFTRSVEKKYPYENFIYPHGIFIHEVSNYLIGFARKILMNHILRDLGDCDKYFVFPLHYMDDAQITFREPMIDQFTLIRNISRALPNDYYLYVKPHPHYFGTDVSIKKIAKIAKLKNVKIINSNLLPISIIKNSKGVITINSTTGFEALILGLPVITFGHDFYCKEDLCYVVRDIIKLADILAEVATGKTKFSRTNIEKFVAEVYTNTIWVDSINYDYGFDGLTDNDGKKIAFALDKIIEKWRENHHVNEN